MIYAIIGKVLNERHEITAYRVAILNTDLYGVDHLLKTKAYRDTNIMRLDAVRKVLVPWGTLKTHYYNDVPAHVLQGQLSHWKDDTVDNVWSPDPKYLIPIGTTDVIKQHKKTNIILFRKVCSDGVTVYFVLNHNGYISVYTKSTILATLDKVGYSNAYIRNLDELVITGAKQLPVDIDENVKNEELNWKAAYTEYLNKSAKILNQVVDTPVGRVVDSILNNTPAYKAGVSLTEPPTNVSTTPLTPEEKFKLVVRATEKEKQEWVRNLNVQLDQICNKKEESNVVPTASQLFKVLGKGASLLSAVGGLAGGPGGIAVGNIAKSVVVGVVPSEYIHEQITKNKALSSAAKKLLKTYMNSPKKDFILYQLSLLVGSDLGYAKYMGAYKNLSGLTEILYELDTQKVKKVMDKHKNDYYFNPIYPALSKSLLHSYSGELMILNGLKQHRRHIVEAIEIAYSASTTFMRSGGVVLSRDTHTQLEKGVIYNSDNYTISADSLNAGVWSLCTDWELKTFLQLGTYYLNNLSGLDAFTLDSYNKDIGLLCSERMVYALSLFALYYAYNIKKSEVDAVEAFARVTTECFDTKVNINVSKEEIVKID